MLSDKKLYQFDGEIYDMDVSNLKKCKLNRLGSSRSNNFWLHRRCSRWLVHAKAFNVMDECGYRIPKVLGRFPSAGWYPAFSFDLTGDPNYDRCIQVGEQIASDWKCHVHGMFATYCRAKMLFELNKEICFQFLLSEINLGYAKPWMAQMLEDCDVSGSVENNK